MKKYLLLICVLLCFLLFAGCKQNTDVSDDTTGSKTDVQNETAVVADSSGVLYTIIRPQSADDATIQATVTVYDALSELTGSPLSLSPVDASPLVENAQSAAENFADTKTNTAHIVYCTPSLNGGDIIDNIYLTPDSLTVVNLVTVVTGKSVQGSDHCPIYIDFTLK